MVASPLRRRVDRVVVISCSVAMASVPLSACSGKSPKLAQVTPSTTTFAIPSTSTPTTNPNPVVTFSLYFVRGGSLGVSDRSQPTRSARSTAIHDLFAGPSAVETAAGLTTQIPPGSLVEGLAEVNGVSYLDVNANFLLDSTSRSAAVLRLAQVVYTLTSSPPVTSVQFLLHGQPPTSFAGIDLSKPVTRSDLTEAIGPLLLQRPAVGDTITDPLYVAGMSEMTGSFEVQLLNPAGNLLASSEQTTTTGAAFMFTMPFTQADASTDRLRIYTAASAGGPTELLLDLSVPFHP